MRVDGGGRHLYLLGGRLGARRGRRRQPRRLERGVSLLDGGCDGGGGFGRREKERRDAGPALIWAVGTMALLRSMVVTPPTVVTLPT